MPRQFAIGTCFLIIAALFSTSSCSVPNLEKPSCSEARDVVKRLYSVHFGGDMAPTAGNLEQLRPYLTEELSKELAGAAAESDYFTRTDKYPTAFRVGSCKEDSEEKVTMQVVLIWKNNPEFTQKEVHVETVKTGDKRLVNKVTD